MSNYFMSGATANGNYTTDRVNDRDQHYYLSIVFYTDEALTQAANPTAGVATVTASETGDQYGDVGTIQASNAGVNSTYDRLAFSGSISKIKVNMSGITGAGFFRLKVGAY